MCGIFLCVCNTSCPFTLPPKCKDLLSRRGPDNLAITARQDDMGHKITACSSVLWLQGDTMTCQPLIDDQENMLMWNGDIFSMEGVDRDTRESDTSLLSRHLSTCQTPEQILQCLARISGPWAMVYLQKSSNTLWFGRDFFGRQSLLISSTSDSLSLSSCVMSDMTSFTELPANGVYSSTLLPGGLLGHITLYPWDCMGDRAHSDTLHLTMSDLTIKCPVRMDMFNQSTTSLAPRPEQEEPALFQHLLSYPDISLMVDQFTAVLRKAVVTRINNQPGLCKKCILARRSSCCDCSVAVMFSGGLDSCVLAFLAAEELPPGQPLHLLNVAFQQGGGGYNVPDRLTGIQAFQVS